MYRPHNPSWFALGFFVCLVLSAVAIVKRRRGQWRIPYAAVVVLGLLTGTQVLLMLGLRAYDDAKLRQELRSIAPAEVTSLMLSRDGVTREIKDKTDATQLLRLVQSLTAAMAHHSSPVHAFTIRFEYRGQIYEYRLAPDSQRPDEFWVFPVGRSYPGGEGIEIGRVHSNELARLVERLLAQLS